MPKINEEIVNFYNNLYNQNFSEPVNKDTFVNVDIMREMASATTIAPITAEELFEAINNTKDSCPGPDGISCSSIKALWNIISHVLID